MQNKKTKRTKADAKNAVANTGKTATSGGADTKKGTADAGKAAPGKGDARKGWKK